MVLNNIYIYIYHIWDSWKPQPVCQILPQSVSTWRQSWPWMTRYFRSWNSFFIPGARIVIDDPWSMMIHDDPWWSMMIIDYPLHSNLKSSEACRLHVAHGLPWSCLGCTHRPVNCLQLDEFNGNLVQRCGAARGTLAAVPEEREELTCVIQNGSTLKTDSSKLEADGSGWFQISFHLGFYTIHIDISDPGVNLAEEPGAMPAAATAAPDSRITMAAMKGFPERFYLEMTSWFKGLTATLEVHALGRQLARYQTGCS